MVWPMRPKPRKMGYLKIGCCRSAILVTGVLVSDDLALRELPDGNAATVRRQHHHALHHRLPADKGFLTAFEDGQHLKMRREAQKTSESHKGAAFIIAGASCDLTGERPDLLGSI